MGSRRVTAAFGIVIAFMGILGIYALHAVWWQYRSLQSMYIHPLAVSNAIRQIDMDMIAMHHELRRIGLGGKQDNRVLHAHENDALRQFDRIQRELPDSRDSILRARQAFVAWGPLYERMIRLVQQHAPASQIDAADSSNDAYLAYMVGLMQPVIEVASGKAQSMQSGARRRAARDLNWIAALLALATLVSIAIAAVVAHSLKRARHKGEEYLAIIAANEQKYRELLDAAPDGIVIVDSGQHIQLANRQAEQIFGYEADELVGLPIDRLVPAILRDRHGSWVGQYLQNPVTRDVKQGRRLEACRKDGSLFPASVSLSPVMLGGEMLVTATVRDMSDEVAIEKKLRQAQKMEAIGTLVGGIAHDFNNILASIMGNIYLARLHDDKLDVRLDAVEREGERAAHIVRKLLSFARKGILQKQVLHLAPLVADAVARFQQTMHEPIHIDVELQLGEDDDCIEGDAEQIGQIAEDLLSNARDALAGRHDPHIRVSLVRMEPRAALYKAHPEALGRRFACLSVEDNGCGIPASRMEHVFEPFYTSKDVGKGIGLGLAMIHGAVISHHGIVELDSELEKGTTVRIYLPLHTQARVAEAGRTIVENASGKGGTVLIAEDEPGLRDILHTVMADQGYEVLAVTNGIEAVEGFFDHSERVGLVIMDVLMPRMGGIEAAYRIREMHPEVPIVFITAHDREAISDSRIDEIDHSAVIGKPFAIDELLRIIAVLRH